MWPAAIRAIRHRSRATCSRPGALPGKRRSSRSSARAYGAYSTDLNNWAPSVGLQLDAERRRTGLLGSLMGQPGEFAIRGGYAARVSAQRPDRLHGRVQRESGRRRSRRDRGARGRAISARRRLIPAALPRSGQSQSAGFPEKPVYPMTDVVTQDVNVFDPSLQVPYADTYTIGVQRGLTRTMAFEVRYVGTRSREQFATYNLNEINIHRERLPERVQARAGQPARARLGRLRHDRPTGAAPSRTAAPALARRRCRSTSRTSTARRRNNAAAYAGGNWTNATFINPLARNNPNRSMPPTRSTTMPDGARPRWPPDSRRICSSPTRTTWAGPTSPATAATRGSTACSWSCGAASRVASSSRRATPTGSRRTRRATRSASPRQEVRQSGGEGEVTHALKLNWVFELPFGQGKRWANQVNGVMDRIIGGWQIHGNMRDPERPPRGLRQRPDGRLRREGASRGSSTSSASTATAAYGCCRRRSLTRP